METLTRDLVRQALAADPDKWFTTVDFPNYYHAGTVLSTMWRKGELERQKDPATRQYGYRKSQGSTPPPATMTTSTITSRLTVVPFSAAQQLAQALVTYVDQVVEAQVAKFTKELMAEIHKHQLLVMPPAEPEVSKPNRPKVLIVGLLPAQQEQIRKNYWKDFDLRFFGSDENTALLGAKAKNMEYVILVTKFISHRHSDIVRGHPGLRYANGGIESVEETLVGIA